MFILVLDPEKYFDFQCAIITKTSKRNTAYFIQFEYFTWVNKLLVVKPLFAKQRSGNRQRGGPSYLFLPKAKLLCVYKDCRIGEQAQWQVCRLKFVNLRLATLWRTHSEDEVHILLQYAGILPFFSLKMYPICPVQCFYSDPLGYQISFRYYNYNYL